MALLLGVQLGMIDLFVMRIVASSNPFSKVCICRHVTGLPAEANGAKMPSNRATSITNSESDQMMSLVGCGDGIGKKDKFTRGHF